MPVMNRLVHKKKRKAKNFAWRRLYAYLNSLDDEVLRAGFISIIVISVSMYAWFDEGWYKAREVAVKMLFVFVSIYLAINTFGIVLNALRREFELNFIKQTALLVVAWLIIAFLAKEVLNVSYERAVQGLGLLLGYFTVIGVITLVVFWIQTRRGR